MLTRRQNGSQESVPPFHLFPLPGILPETLAISVNLEHYILSLVSRSHDLIVNPIMYEAAIYERRLRPILVLLAFPHFCPYPLLRASSDCTFSDLFTGIVYPNSPAATGWHDAVQYRRHRLEQAQQKKMIRNEMHPLYVMITEIRPVLEPFRIGVVRASKGDGYQLVPLGAWTDPA